LERSTASTFALPQSGRFPLLSMSINLDTHIMDIVNFRTWEDIENACLVGHSYGALVPLQTTLPRSRTTAWSAISRA
jgi:hypothetical protein